MQPRTTPDNVYHHALLSSNMFGERVGRPRRDLIRAFHNATVPCNLPGVDWVTFQPGPHQNSDQMVAEGPWDILGQRWLFLAVCDGMFVLLISVYSRITTHAWHVQATVDQTRPASWPTHSPNDCFQRLRRQYESTVTAFWIAKTARKRPLILSTCCERR